MGCITDEATLPESEPTMKGFPYWLKNESLELICVLYIKYLNRIRRYHICILGIKFLLFFEKLQLIRLSLELFITLIFLIFELIKFYYNKKV